MWSQSLHDNMREEVAATWLLHDQRFDCVVFTVGGAEVWLSQWKPDVTLFEQTTNMIALVYKYCCEKRQK